MKKKYRGSCHCGNVRFEVELDLNAGTGKCNCSICAKTRFWSAMVRPDAFRLLAGETDLSDYQFASNSVHHLFCKRCGVHPFVRGQLDATGGEFYAINLGCLDDVNPKELATAPIRYADGRNNNWKNAPPETRHL